MYESTIYLNATEEAFISVLEQVFGLKFDQDFFASYSLVQINIDDKLHYATNILKVTLGSTSEAVDFVDTVYQSIVTVDTHKVLRIKVAEAAKVIENTQCNVSIALN